MDIILISSRGSGGASEWSRVLARRAAAELAEAGHAVRWLCSVSRGEEPSSIGGVDFFSVAAPYAGWRRVQAAIEDPEMELLLASELRRSLPDVVHVVGYGSGGSAALLWITRRMGVAPLVTLRARELLCHRQSLIDEQGRECRAWADVRRCVECCLTATPEGLTPGHSRIGRLLEPLGAWSPYPNRLAFLNRLEMLLGSVDNAEKILVGSEDDRELLKLAGISVPVQVVDPESSHGVSLVDHYRDLAVVP